MLKQLQIRADSIKQVISSSLLEKRYEFSSHPSFYSYVNGIDVEGEKEKASLDQLETEKGIPQSGGNVIGESNLPSYEEAVTGEKKSPVTNIEVTNNDDKPPPQVATTTVVGSRSLQMLEDLRKGNKLDKFLEANGLSVPRHSLVQLKEAFENFLSKQNTTKEQEISKYEQQIESLRDLLDEKNLEKWIQSLGLPATQVSVPQLQQELQKYFSLEDGVTKEPHWGKRSKEKDADAKSHDSEKSKLHVRAHVKTNVARVQKTFASKGSENKVSSKERLGLGKVPRDYGSCLKLHEFHGRSLIFQEETLACRLWEKFRGMSTPKQVAIIVAITVATAALGYVSWQILAFAFPALFEVNAFWIEVLAQWFIQRQESTFHLLQHTAQNAKPLSTAWANQYLLWKYI